MANSKFERFIKSVLHYEKSSARMILFSRFLQAEYDCYDFLLYLQILAFFDESKQSGLGLFMT